MPSSILASDSSASGGASTARLLSAAPKISILILAVTMALALFGEKISPHSPIAINPREGERPARLD